MMSLSLFAVLRASKFTWPLNSRIDNWRRPEYVLDIFVGKCSNCCPSKCNCRHRHTHIWHAYRLAGDRRPHNQVDGRENSDSRATWTVCRWRRRRKSATAPHTNCRVDPPTYQSATKTPATNSPETWPHKMWSFSGDGSPPANWCRQICRQRQWGRPASLCALAIYARRGIHSSAISTRRTSTPSAT